MNDEFAPNPPGGLADTSTRIVAEVLPTTIGQTVVVDIGNMTH